MPIKYTDTHVCEKCGKTFEWNYFESVRQHIDSPTLIVEHIPKDITRVHLFKQSNDGSYDVAVNCPHCDYDNHFSFNENNK